MLSPSISFVFNLLVQAIAMNNFVRFSFNGRIKKKRCHSCITKFHKEYLHSRLPMGNTCKYMADHVNVWQKPL